jgi:hypothetical protein
MSKAQNRNMGRRRKHGATISQMANDNAIEGK